MKINTSILSVLFFIAVVFLVSACVPLLIGGGGAAVVLGSKFAKQEKTVGQSVSDTTIWSKIRANLARRGVDNLMLGSINVKVEEGRVLLTGTVPSKYKIVAILKACWSVGGVKEVINELRIAKQAGSLLNSASDAWVTARIKSKMIATRNIASVNYTVETIDKIVYLFGVAKSQDELDRVTDIASSLVKVKKIVSYVRIKKDVRDKMSQTKGNKKFLAYEHETNLDNFDLSDDQLIELDPMEKPKIIKPNRINRKNKSTNKNEYNDSIFETDDY